MANPAAVPSVTFDKKDVNIWSSHNTGISEAAMKDGFSASIKGEAIQFVPNARTFEKKDKSVVRFVSVVKGTSGAKIWNETKYGKSVTLENIQVTK